MTAQQHQGEDPVLAEVRATRKDIAELNVKLFGEPDGTVPAKGRGGRLVELEEESKDTKKRVSYLEKIAYGGLGAIALIEFILHLSK